MKFTVFQTGPLLYSFASGIIDLIHCSYYRGGKFRPAFEKLELGGLRAFTSAPFMALTASADSSVQEVIQSSFHLASPVIVSKSLDRPNVFISVGEINGYNVSVPLNLRKLYMIDSVIILPCCIS